MKSSKQLLHLISRKASKSGKYQNLAIAILIVGLFPYTMATALTSTNRAKIRTFDSTIQQSSVGNIASKPIFSKAPTILVADAINSSKDDNLITSFNQSFDQAWQEKEREKSLFTVCDNHNKVRTLICFDLLESYLQKKVSLWTNACYKQRANLVLCLGYFSDKGTTAKDLEQWINESALLKKEILNAPDSDFSH